MPARTTYWAAVVPPSGASFNGGAGTCPPGRARSRSDHRDRTAFNGGAGTCPPGPAAEAVTVSGCRAFNGGAGTCPPGHEQSQDSQKGGNPSMEGRARARPDTEPI